MRTKNLTARVVTRVLFTETFRGKIKRTAVPEVESVIVHFEPRLKIKRGDPEVEGLRAAARFISDKLRKIWDAKVAQRDKIKVACREIRGLAFKSKTAPKTPRKRKNRK